MFFAENDVVKVKLTVDLFDIKCHHFNISLSN